MTPATEYALRTPTTIGARGEPGLPLSSFFGLSLFLSLTGDAAVAPARTLPFSLSLSLSLSFVLSLSLSLSSSGSLRFGVGETEAGSVKERSGVEPERYGESEYSTLDQVRIDCKTVQGE